MREFLNLRLIELKNQYSEGLSKIGKSSSSSEEDISSENWKYVEDKKSRIDEIKSVIEFFNENNYVNS